MKAIPFVVVLGTILTACGGTGESTDSATVSSTAAAQPTHLGGCILLSPSTAVPDDVYQRGEVVAIDDLPPFTKALDVYGLKLAAGDDISDEFMSLVAQAIAEVFPKNASLDLAMQRKVLGQHYRYNALIPVPLGDDFSFMEDNEEQWSALESQHSICDIIMQDVPVRQVMEVVEHILHYVTDIGLHYTYPEVWGIHRQSQLAEAMRKSVDEGYFDVSSYDDIDEPDVRFRVEMQEFAYWFISTAWNLQELYGPIHEQEWTIRNSDELRQKLPEFFGAYEQTAARVMVAPSAETLERIGPTIEEEGAN